ncbi:complement C3-like, partial [Brachionichthys hirsutus]|uniref:complement C3-like n=1 Tax=Brachionichthys hirsutus TaxID=412623 RepID=UPI0036052FCE
MGQWTLHILSLVLLYYANGQFPISSKSRFVMLAPDLLRTDSQENIYLQADGLSRPITVSISIQDFRAPTVLLQDSVTLSPANGFQTMKTIQLPSERLNRDEKKNKFVHLRVNFENLYTEERVVMVSFQSGYIFIQTDKPIYNPGDTVRFRAFVSSPSFKAFDSSITIDIKNPDNVVVKQIPITRAVNGILAGIFPLSEIVNEGPWTVIAKFDHWQQNKFTSKFEVKKYVLPAFNVTLTPKKPFLDLDDAELLVDISARYLYGEPVQGTAYVVFGVKINQEMIRLPLVKQVSDLDGGVARLSMEELKSAYPNIRSLVGNSLYVKASVLTKSGSDLVEAEKSGITIVLSPYEISFKDISKYFKPNLPFDFTIHVTHHDGSPARNVQVKVNLLEAPLIVLSGTSRVSVNMPPNRRTQIITAETVQAGLRPEQQAKHQIIVQMHRPYSNLRRNYLYISTGTNRVSVGDTLSLKLTISTTEQSHRVLIKHITYLVLSKGRIIKAHRVDVTNQVLTSIGLTVTPEMLPSFRFVAFYAIPWQRGDELVSDAIWVDVVDSCPGQLTVGPVDGRYRDFTPGKSILFQVRGDPGAKVSLVAVDNAVYLLKKDRLTQGKIWDVVEHGDLGCTRGGGKDALSVLTDAGLLYTSSGGMTSTTRNDLQCPSSARKKRSAERLQRRTRLESYYKEKLQHRCCKDGLRDIPMPYSCTRRSFYITEGWECIRAFRHCCSSYRDQEFDTEIPTTLPPTTTTPTTTARPRPSFPIQPNRQMDVSARTFGVRAYGQIIPKLQSIAKVVRVEPREESSQILAVAANNEVEEEEEEEEEWEYQDENQIYLRKKFFESWLWTDIDLPTQADRDGLASKNVDNAVLPDSITEWGILAISASPDTGFCVAEPYNVRAWKHFFVDLRLPYSVARNEQVEIKAVIHNYGFEELHVRVVLMKTKDMCSVAYKDRHTQEVTLPVGSSIAVPYTIVPLVVGKLPLEVVVVARDMMGGDRIQKFLRVVLDGVQKTAVQSAVLNPSAEGGEQRIRMGKVELKSVVPNSQPET